MKFINNRYFKRGIFSLQIITMIIFFIAIYISHMLPNYYTIIIGIVFILILGAEYYFLFHKKDKPIYNQCTQIICLLLSIALSLSSAFVYKINQTVDLMTDKSFQKRALSIVVLKDSSIKNYLQLNHHSLGYMATLDKDSMQFAIEEVKKDVHALDTKDFSDIQKNVEALYNKDVDAIVLDEAFRHLVETYKTSFTDDTRVIHQVFKNEETISSKNVKVTENPFLIYVSGNDEYGDLSTISRSDVNMLIAVHPVQHQILLISIPRDTYYPLHTSQQKDKFTHSGLYGLQESIATLQDIIDEDINYYAKLNFTSFINIIDALGGIEVYSPTAFTTKIGKYKIKEGVNKLNSKQALAFVRERKSFLDGDFARGRNQQRMIAAVIKKICSPSILTSFSSVLNSVSSSVETNMTSQEINSLIQLQLSQMPSWNVQTYQISGTPDSLPCYSSGNMKASVVVPHEDSIQETIQHINDLKEGKIIKTKQGNLNEAQDNKHKSN